MFHLNLFIFLVIIKHISLLELYFYLICTPFHSIEITKSTYNTNHNLSDHVKQRRDHRLPRENVLPNC